MIRDAENIERQFLRDILGPSAGTVLEIGCGDGRLTEIISDVSSSIFALDPDPGSLNEARHLQGNGISLILGSGEHIPLVDNSVDTVIFSLSLHHHPSPGKALTQARSVLKEGGRILILEPAIDSSLNHLFKVLHNEDDAYERAIRSIDTSGLEIADRGIYETSWMFDDFDELVEYMFSHFELEPDPESRDSMARLLGDRRELKPLDIMDVTQYWMLNTNSRRDLAQIP